ncbi:MAG: diguanylate cyclase, partial [Sterolibacterium sp.]
LGNVTISLGITHVYPFDNPPTLIGRADEALYHAKSHGRNQLQYYESLASAGNVSVKEVHTEADIF